MTPMFRVWIVAVLSAGCSTAQTPTAPSGAVAPSAQLSATTGTHGQPLTALLGRGAGTVNVTPTAAVDGSFSAQITVNVHGAPPNTTLYVQRAP